MLLHHSQVTESTPQIFFFSEIHLNRLSRHVSRAFWIFLIFAISGSNTIFITNNSSLWARKQITSRSPIYPGLRRCVVQTPPVGSCLLRQPATQGSCLPTACCLCRQGANHRENWELSSTLLSECFVVILLHKEVELPSIPEHRSFGAQVPSSLALRESSWPAAKALLKATPFYRTI